MSKPMLMAVGLLLLGFGAGVGCGLFLRSSLPDVGSATKSFRSTSSGYFTDAAAQNEVQGNTLLASRIRELEKELAEQKENQTSLIAARFEFFKKHHEQVREGLPAFDSDLKVTSEMAEILNLSPEELKAVNRQMADVKQEMEEFEKENTHVVKQTANGFTIEVPVNPQAKALKDSLSADLSSDVGEDRSSLLLEYADFSPFGSLAQLASGKKDTDIQWTNQNGMTQYTIKNVVFGPEGASGWTSSTSDTLPPEYQKYFSADTGP
jgi:hypothetical protein